MRINSVHLQDSYVVIALRSVLIFIIVTFIIFSNIINIHILRKSHEHQIFSRILFINLSVAGLVNGVFVCLPAFVASFMNCWPLGEVYCQISSLLHGASFAVIIWSLVAIGLDRYVAIHYPVFYRTSNKFRAALFTIANFWILGIIMFAYPLIYKGDFYEFHSNLLMCSLIRHSDIFSIFSAVFIYIISTFVLSFSSYKTVSTLKTISNKRVNWKGQVNNIRTANAIRIILLNGICFLVSWGPYAISDILVSFNIIKTIPPSMDFIITWLANSNSFMNVLIYSGNSHDFRSRLRRCLQNCFSKTPEIVTMRHPESKISLATN